jgi:hypothetical protein
MKKSVEVPVTPAREKSPRKSSPSNSEKGKVTPSQKPVTQVNNTFGPAKPNAHEPVDDELNIPNTTDKEAGMNTPSQEPW